METWYRDRELMEHVVEAPQLDIQFLQAQVALLAEFEDLLTELSPARFCRGDPRVQRDIGGFDLGDARGGGEFL